MDRLADISLFESIQNEANKSLWVDNARSQMSDKVRKSFEWKPEGKSDISRGPYWSNANNKLAAIRANQASKRPQAPDNIEYNFPLEEQLQYLTPAIASVQESGRLKKTLVMDMGKKLVLDTIRKYGLNNKTESYIDKAINDLQNTVIDMRIEKVKKARQEHGWDSSTEKKVSEESWVRYLRMGRLLSVMATVCDDTLDYIDAYPDSWQQDLGMQHQIVDKDGSIIKLSDKIKEGWGSKPKYNKLGRDRSEGTYWEKWRGGQLNPTDEGIDESAPNTDLASRRMDKASRRPQNTNPIQFSFDAQEQAKYLEPMFVATETVRKPSKTIKLQLGKKLVQDCIAKYGLNAQTEQYVDEALLALRRAGEDRYNRQYVDYVRSVDHSTSYPDVKRKKDSTDSHRYRFYRLLSDIAVVCDDELDKVDATMGNWYQNPNSAQTQPTQSNPQPATQDTMEDYLL